MSTTWLCLLLIQFAIFSTGHGANWACPALGGPIRIGICVEECNVIDNSGCAPDENCCDNGCGHVCMSKVPSRGGHIDCSLVRCYIPTCDKEVIFPPGRCCPMCPGQSMPGKRKASVSVASTPNKRARKSATVNTESSNTQTDITAIVKEILPSVTAGVIDILKEMNIIPQLTVEKPAPASGVSGPSIPILDPTATTGMPSQGVQSSVSRPLALGVDPLIKSKIVSDQFVELHQLLKKQEVKFNMTQDSKGHVSFTKSEKAGNDIKSMDQWFRAFHIFISIYVESNTSTGPMLMKHCDTVQQLAKQAGDAAAISYDRQFRLMREACGPTYSFGNLDTELYTPALAQGLARKNQPFLGSKSATTATKFCFAYNNGSCSRKQCKFAHKCQKCSGQHSKKTCNKSDNSATTNKDKSKVHASFTMPVGCGSVSKLDTCTNIVTPVKPDKLKSLLERYNQVETQYLLNGFQHGFKIPFVGQQKMQFGPNLKSALDNMAILKEKISIEIKAGRVAGPFNEPPSSNFRVSPLGLVPKQTPGEYRVIHHLSYPEGESVNDGIPQGLCSVHYQNIDDAVTLIKRIGKGALMSKTDILNAYKIIPIAPSSQELLGFSIDGKFYFDRTLPMGLSFSCNLFERFSQALHWLAEQKLAIPGCVHILDDFLFVSGTDYEQAVNHLHSFIDMTAEIGVPIKQEKTVLPCTTITFVGIELDSQAMEKRLPVEKLDKIRNQLHEMQNREKATLRELQSLVGLLSYACAVVAPGRTFLRRLIDLTIGLKKKPS